MAIPFRLLGTAAALLGCLLAIFFSVLSSSGVGGRRVLFGRTDFGDRQVGHDDRGGVRSGRTLHLNSNGFSSQKRTKARIAFLIMASGDDAGRLHLLLPEIYHPDNIYLVHVDAKTPAAKVALIRDVVERTFPSNEDHPPRGRLLEPAGVVSWGGFSMTLACLYGIAAALLWDDEWDYFVNLSTADFPVLTQDEMQLFLGEYAESRTNFMEGTLMTGFEKRWQGYVEDQGLQRRAMSHTTIAMTLLGNIERPHPQRFDLYKGEFWTVLHRSFCEYVSWSPDNVARTLSAYFTGYRISDESYFQTLACHPEGIEFPVHGDCLRFTSWNEDHLDEHGRKVDANGNILIHPEPLGEVSIENIKASGTLFARKFDYVASHTVYRALQEELRNEAGSAGRLRRVRARVGKLPSEITGRSVFCGHPEGLRHRGMLAAGDEVAGKSRHSDGSSSDSSSSSRGNYARVWDWWRGGKR